MEAGGLIFAGLVLGGLWVAWRNLRAALRGLAGSTARGSILGAVLGWWLGD